MLLVVPFGFMDRDAVEKADRDRDRDRVLEGVGRNVGVKAFTLLQHVHVKQTKTAPTRARRVKALVGAMFTVSVEGKERKVKVCRYLLVW